MNANQRAQFNKFFDVLHEHMGNDPFMAAKTAWVLDDENAVIPASRLEHMRFFIDARLGGREFRVGKTDVAGANVSTVFIGEQRIIFETMVSGGPLDGRFYRWKTWEAAEAGHKSVCKWCEQGSDE